MSFVLGKVAAGLSLSVAWNCYKPSVCYADSQYSPITKAVEEIAKQWIDAGTYTQLPRAKTGHTPVFFVPDAPVVLKKKPEYGTEKGAFEERFRIAQELRTFCRRQGLNHLVVPEEVLYKDFLITEKVPIQGNESSILGMAFYLDHREELSPAIRELTHIFYAFGRRDVVTTQSLYAYPKEELVWRFDNLTPYCDPVTGEYKIALIDVESYYPDYLEEFSIPEVLIAGFPHHAEAIMQEAIQHDPAAAEFDWRHAKERGLLVYARDLEGYKQFIEDHGLRLNGSLLLPASLKTVQEKWEEYLAQGDGFLSISEEDSGLFPHEIYGFTSSTINPSEIPERRKKIAQIADWYFPKAFQDTREVLEKSIQQCAQKTTLPELMDCREVGLSATQIPQSVVTMGDALAKAGVMPRQEAGHQAFSQMLNALKKEGSLYDSHVHGISNLELHVWGGMSCFIDNQSYWVKS